MHVVIVGAGVAGLSAAWQLQKKLGVSITIVEKEGRVGGEILSKEIDGMLFEMGPHSLRYNEETVRFLEEVGLGSSMFFASAKQRYLYTSGKLKTFSTHLMRPSLLWPLLTEWCVPSGKEEDESVEAFFTRRFGQAFYESCINPMTRGIYAGDPSRLSAKSCFPHFFHLEREGKSVTKALFSQKKTSVYTLKGGLESLPKRLLELFKGELLLNERFLRFEGGSVYTDKRKIKADRVILAFPAFTMKKASLKIVSFGWKRHISHPPGFGYLIPDKEGESALGAVFDSSIFPERENETRISYFMRYESDATSKALEALERHLKIKIPPDVVIETPLFERLPQYEVGFSKALKEFCAALPKEISYIGWGRGGISVNDSICSKDPLPL